MGLRLGLEPTPGAAPAAALLLALLAGLWPAPAAAPAKSRTQPPVITNVAPKKATIGEKLSIRGRYFRAGRGRNTVVFKRDGFPAVFVKADISTTKMMRVTVSEKLAPFLAVRAGTPQFTAFRMRILAERFGRAFTPLSMSPLIGPEKPPVPPKPPGGR